MTSPHDSRRTCGGTDDAPAAGSDPDECSNECEAALDCHMRRFMTSIDAAAQAQGQSFAAIKVGPLAEFCSCSGLHV